jgi:hypothetical protein
MERTAPKIRTEGIWPPIPTRAFDYCATYEDDEPNDDGQMAAGYGATREEAVADLLDNYPR